MLTTGTRGPAYARVADGTHAANRGRATDGTRGADGA
jgi:hypothetical protein